MVFMRLFSEYGTHHIFFVDGRKKAAPLYRSSPFDTLADLTLFICHGATAQAQ